MQIRMQMGCRSGRRCGCQRGVPARKSEIALSMRRWRVLQLLGAGHPLDVVALKTVGERGEECLSFGRSVECCHEVVGWFDRPQRLVHRECHSDRVASGQPGFAGGPQR